jgi:hypothetical protein
MKQSFFLALGLLVAISVHAHTATKNEQEVQICIVDVILMSLPLGPGMVTTTPPEHEFFQKTLQDPSTAVHKAVDFYCRNK